MLKKTILLLVIFPFLAAHSQNKDYARFVVDTLSSDGMFGRGYVNNGDKIAAQFIFDQFSAIGLESFDESYYQNFVISINTLPGKLSLKVDNQKLLPGKDFVVYASSPSAKGKYKVIRKDLADLGLISAYQLKPKNANPDKVIVTSTNPRKYKGKLPSEYAGIIYLTDNNPAWHVSDGGKVKDYFTAAVNQKSFPEDCKKISLEIENKYYANYITQNVIGYIEGKQKPEQFIVFTAHYDHLGMMGNQAIFPGSNDNASGTAMMMDLAAFYADPDNQPEYSVVFIAFSAEEAGLLGSTYFVDNPLFPVEKIRFLVNLDLVGSGSQGIKVVNGSVFQDEFEMMVQINRKYNLLEKVSPRGEAANSDHYPFYASGVPSFFIYTLGNESKEYHSIYDTPDNVPYTEYEDLFMLLVNFVNRL